MKVEKTIGIMKGLIAADIAVAIVSNAVRHIVPMPVKVGFAVTRIVLGGSMMGVAANGLNSIMQDMNEQEGYMTTEGTVV